MKWLLGLMIIAVYVLHQDYWNWHNRTLAFGPLPAGLAYHAAYACLAAVMMWVLVKTAWPEHLEREVADLPERPEEDPHA